MKEPIENQLMTWAIAIVLMPALLAGWLAGDNRGSNAGSFLGTAIVICIVFLPLTLWFAIPLFSVGWVWSKLFPKKQEDELATRD
tara:strand:+ start:317 stop:571 length:255 start_codon:yes stop_codon:yes gene_type:complete